MNGAPVARAVSLKDTLPRAFGCRAWGVSIAREFSPTLSICRRAVRRGYIEDGNASAIAALTPFILVP
jgi:hypothetical protein